MSTSGWHLVDGAGVPGEGRVRSDSICEPGSRDDEGSQPMVRLHQSPDRLFTCRAGPTGHPSPDKRRTPGKTRRFPDADFAVGAHGRARNVPGAVMTKAMITERVAEMDATMAAHSPDEVMVFNLGAWWVYYNITLASSSVARFEGSTAGPANLADSRHVRNR